MENRHSLYKEVHKGLRALLLELVESAGRTDFTDAASLASLRSLVQSGFALLESHAHHENEFIIPELERLLPELARRNGEEHAAHEPEMSGLLSLLERIDPTKPDAAFVGHQFVVALSRLAAELTIHMAEEEESIMPALWNVLDDDALVEIEQRLVSNIPPDKMGYFLKWMIPAMNTPERVGMLVSMRAGAPPEVFEGVRELARTVLSPMDDEALSRGLASVA